MKLEPNTTNQLRIADRDGDEAWFDMIDTELVITLKTWPDGTPLYTVALLDADDIGELLKHLKGSA